MYIKNLKKSVTPIIAVIMLLLITLSLSGTALVMFNQLSKQTEADIKQELKKFNIKGKILITYADPNSDEFEFIAVNLFNRKIPVDDINSKFFLEINGIAYACSLLDSSSKCYCDTVELLDLQSNTWVDTYNGKRIIDIVTTEGMVPGKRYKFYCSISNANKVFSIIDDNQLVWVFLGDGRELDRAVLDVGGKNY